MALSIKLWSTVNLTKTASSQAGLQVGDGAIITKSSEIDPVLGYYKATSSDDASQFDPDGNVYKMIQARYASGYASKTLYIVRQFEKDTPLKITGQPPASIDNFQAISDGSFDVTLNGHATTIGSLDFTKVNPTTRGDTVFNFKALQYDNLQKVSDGNLGITIDGVESDLAPLDFTLLDNTRGHSSLTISEAQYKAMSAVDDGDITLAVDGVDDVLTGIDFTGITTASHGKSVLTLTETQYQALYKISNGYITMAVDGVDDVLTGISFTGISVDPAGTTPDLDKFATEFAAIIQTKSTKNITCTGSVLVGTDIQITMTSPSVGTTSSVELKKSATGTGTDLSIATLLDVDNQVKSDFDIQVFADEFAAIIQAKATAGLTVTGVTNPALNAQFFNIELESLKAGTTSSVAWKQSATSAGTDLSVPLMLNIAGQQTTTLDLTTFTIDFTNVLSTAMPTSLSVVGTVINADEFSIKITSNTEGDQSSIVVDKALVITGTDVSVDTMFDIANQTSTNGTGVAHVISYDQIAKVINDSLGANYVVAYDVLNKYMSITSVVAGVTETASNMVDSATGTPVLSLLGWDAPVISNGQSEESVTHTLERLKNQGVRWYQQFYDVGYTDDEVKEIGAWCSTPNDIDGDTQGHMLYFEVNGSLTNLDGTAFDDLSKRNYDYVAVYNKQQQPYLAMACGGVMSEIDYSQVDSNQNMAGRALNGFIPDDLTLLEWQRLKELKINCYTTYGADQPMFFRGKTLGAGKWVDAVAGTIAFLSELQVKLFTAFYQGSIPYSSSGSMVGYQIITNTINKYKVANVISGRNITESSKQKIVRVFGKKNAPDTFMQQGYLVYTPNVSEVDPVTIDEREFPAFQVMFTTTNFINKYTTNATELR